ncbi:MAG: hypothetical protein M3Q58_03390 [Bacteroidota bacterium]|nr:hypothetical protein [Bacteroidota bacterium]
MEKKMEQLQMKYLNQLLHNYSTGLCRKYLNEIFSTYLQCESSTSSTDKLNLTNKATICIKLGVCFNDIQSIVENKNLFQEEAEQLQLKCLNNLHDCFHFTSIRQKLEDIFLTYLNEEITKKEINSLAAIVSFYLEIDAFFLFSSGLRENNKLLIKSEI